MNNPIAYKDMIKHHVLNLATLQGVSGRSLSYQYMRMNFGRWLTRSRLTQWETSSQLSGAKTQTGGPRIMIAAHSDEIGLIVKSIEESVS